jgi:ABC-type uncharacterized transport system involved in gliding motility auxiliary subunit
MGLVGRSEYKPGSANCKRQSRPRPIHASASHLADELVEQAGWSVSLAQELVIHEECPGAGALGGGMGSSLDHRWGSLHLSNYPHGLPVRRAIGIRTATLG